MKIYVKSHTSLSPDSELNLIFEIYKDSNLLNRETSLNLTTIKCKNTLDSFTDNIDKKLQTLAKDSKLVKRYKNKYIICIACANTKNVVPLMKALVTDIGYATPEHGDTKAEVDYSLQLLLPKRNN